MQRKNLSASSTLSGIDARTAVMVISALLLAVPTYAHMAQHIWAVEEQSYGPVILALSLWLMWRSRDQIAALDTGAAGLKGTRATYGLLGVTVLFYAIGRSQAIVQLEALAVVMFIACGLSMRYGARVLRLVWFPLFLLLFTVPLPGVLVQALTLPLKSVVSFVAESILHAAGYPVARTGVIITVGQYQMLVADACAGLTSIFTLEAIGLVYIELMKYQSRARCILLAIAVVPCAFIANVVRVCVLVLVTYHFGNEAGQGFMHGFAGILLFAVAVIGIVMVDRVLGLFFSSRPSAPSLVRSQPI
jgi:exosortase B